MSDTTQPGYSSPGQEIQEGIGELAASSQQQPVPSMQQPEYSYSAPFGAAEAQMPKQAGSGKVIVWALAGALGVILVGAVGLFVYHSLQDPYRTLDSFPVTRYMEDYQGVVGSRFRAEVVVDAELGGSFERGRLLSFRDTVTQNSIVVLVPPSLSQISFSKGQTYVTELEVGQGGLVQAHGFKKK